MKHTKGPWKCEQGAVYTQDGTPIAYMDREIGNPIRPVERDRNAYLIAAAPDLLEACKNAYADLASLYWIERRIESVSKGAVSRPMEALQTAIAKAESEE